MLPESIELDISLQQRCEDGKDMFDRGYVLKISLSEVMVSVANDVVQSSTSNCSAGAITTEIRVADMQQQQQFFKSCSDQNGRGQCKLYPISPFPDELATAMFPNERMSLDDCHLRYYKHGKQGLVAPAFGEPAYLREFAHMAAIGWTKPDGTISWKCGGSLVWDNYVLTAAHCVTDNGSSPDVARFGDINIFSDEDDQFAQQLRIVQIIRHPDHRFSTTYNDIALLKLEANVTLHPTVSPACLWKDEDIRFPTLEATGWGDTGFAQERTPTLLKVTLKPINNSECHESYGTSLRRLREGIKNHQMCAGDERMDTCPGDSGGPLQVRLLHNGKMTPFLVGVTSFGSACGNANPGVYTRVSSFFTWIEETIRKEENFPICNAIT
ncbi:AAEL005650-PA [Aedes aegypti]|uniref:AAEL005650-PA n=1 Tax=Aedes aegypti TaxID=7159 RepID=Q179E4_AEDAE|nr:AAEL005650-PA [Aedes aegypti]